MIALQTKELKLVKTKLLTLIPMAMTAIILSGCTATDPEVARERECRTVDSATGSRMKESICMSKTQWARIDAAEAERIAQQNDTDAFLRQSQEYNAQNPVSPGDVYNPYPGF